MAIETAVGGNGHGGCGNAGVRCLLLEAGFDRMAALAQHHYPYLPAKWLVRDKFDSARRMTGLDVPGLLILGRRDRIVPLKFVEALAASTRGKADMLIVDAAGHNDLYDHGVVEHAIGFIEKHCRS